MDEKPSADHAGLPAARFELHCIFCAHLLRSIMRTDEELEFKLGSHVHPYREGGKLHSIGYSKFVPPSAVQAHDYRRPFQHVDFDDVARRNSLDQLVIELW
ncbi:hypothetical protein OHB49_43495 (plasmid) [Streptomyces sp. NBC_01717]|uniref:hypothetical protein n=1 Tax=Streptomyces sp. NBC_01717 TaxID=2975918 RepID=UPI002E33D225|nr:hypothetical protein [Streptomyces sp. NBC_01717]